MAKRFTTQLFVSSNDKTFLIFTYKFSVIIYNLLFSVFEFLFSIAGLSAYTTDQSLRQLFAPFGQIIEGTFTKSDYVSLL